MPGHIQQRCYMPLVFRGLEGIVNRGEGRNMAVAAIPLRLILD